MLRKYTPGSEYTWVVFTLTIGLGTPNSAGMKLLFPYTSHSTDTIFPISQGTPTMAVRVTGDPE